MDKRLLFAVVLSVIVISIGFMIQNLFFAPEPTAIPEREFIEEDAGEIEPQVSEDQDTIDIPEETEFVEGTVESLKALNQDKIESKELRYPLDEDSSDTMRVILSNRGGSIKSIILPQYENVEMILPKENSVSTFNLYPGTKRENPIDDLFYVTRSSSQSNVIEFYQDFLPPGNEQPLRIIKRYTFQPNEYLFRLEVEIQNSVNDYIPLDYEGYSYSIGVGPQIGPEFDKLDGRNEYRKFLYFAGGKDKGKNLRQNDNYIIPKEPEWFGVIGKYFEILTIPNLTDYRGVFSTVSKDSGIDVSHRFYVDRPIIKSSVQKDTYLFYVGPKTGSVLKRYNEANTNSFGVSGLQLDESLSSRPLIGWLENILIFFLDIFYKIIPNYGVAILLLTVLVKLILFPLTMKSSKSTKKMSELTPKRKEIEEKYKDNAAKKNQELADLYKKEGVNPLGGCLPLLLQFPFFIAMYGVCNNYFELRGATFIPGWITDLSSPESILTLPFSLPFLGEALRLLPVIYVTTQILSSKLTQAPGSSQTKNMRIMAYALPLVFFFILYNVPSGLLIYWILSNTLTAGQQFYINNFYHGKNKGDNPPKQMRKIK
jgi:YidC/Oxa1 family membrane protein insertase